MLHRRATTALLLALALTLPAAASALTDDDTARLLAGLPIDDAALQAADEAGLDTDDFAEFAEDVEDGWQQYFEDFADPINAWSRETLAYEPGDTLFYPFSGPDFITAHRFYPNAPRYVMVAKQNAGRMPDLLASSSRTDRILDLYEANVDQFARIGFFITSELNEQFDRGNADLEGLTSMIAVMAVREGYRIDSIEPIRINADGSDLEVHPGDRDDEDTWESVRLHVTRPSDGHQAVIDYVDLDISDENLESDAAAWAWINHVSRSRVVIKAASHLPNYDSFTMIVRAWLDHALSIVQEETGVNYDELAAVFDVRLFGTFERPNNNFSSHLQRTLVAAYDERTDIEPLPFDYGYWKPEGYGLQYAWRRLADASDTPAASEGSGDMPALEAAE